MTIKLNNVTTTRNFIKTRKAYASHSNNGMLPFHLEVYNHRLPLRPMMMIKDRSSSLGMDVGGFSSLACPTNVSHRRYYLLATMNRRQLIRDVVGMSLPGDCKISLRNIRTEME
jgi:hypothetical protein